jgi:hypothetical protein
MLMLESYLSVVVACLREQTFEVERAARYLTLLHGCLFNVRMGCWPVCNEARDWRVLMLVDQSAGSILHLLWMGAPKSSQQRCTNTQDRVSCVAEDFVAVCDVCL